MKNYKQACPHILMLNGSLYSHLDGGSTFLSVECPSKAWPLNLLAIRVSLRPIFPLLTVKQADMSHFTKE